MHELVREAEALEHRRLEHLRGSQGLDAALSFARRTCELYRQAILRRSAQAATRHYRARFLGSYRVLRAYVKAQPPG